MRLRTDKRIALVLLVIVAFSIAGFRVGWMAGASDAINNAVYQSGTQASDSSYTIFRVGSTYYAKSGATGAIDYCGINGSTIFSDAVQALPAYGGMITVLPGEYVANVSLDASNIALKGYGVRIKGTVSLGSQAVRRSEITIEGTFINGTLNLINMDFARILHVTVQGGIDIDGRESELGGSAYGWCATTTFRSVQINNALGTGLYAHNGAKFLRLYDTYIIGNAGQRPFSINASFSIIQGLTVEDYSGTTLSSQFMGTDSRAELTILGDTDLTMAGSWENDITILMNEGDITNIGTSNSIHSLATWPKYHRSERTGYFLLPALNSTITITHGLLAEPLVVIVSPKGDVGYCWISSKSSTTFVVTVSDPSAGGVWFDYYASINP